MYNDFKGFDEDGNPVKISVPPTLKIKAGGVIEDISKCISPEAKFEGDLVYVIGETKEELGGSEYYRMIGDYVGNNVPKVNAEKALGSYKKVEQAISNELIASCHSVGLGGLGVALAEVSLGGKLGSGNQWFPWVHVRDLSRAIEFVAQKDDISGPVNVSAPETLTNAEFTKALAGVLHRPAIFPVPAFALKLAIGQSAQAVLASARMRPKVLEDNGFSFDFPELNPALKDIVG